MNRRVLIVEDDPLTSKLTRDVLQANGFETQEIGDGSAALSTAVDMRVGLIVMDIGLPGLDGVEATRVLKADPRTAEIPVVAVTAYVMPGDDERMRRAGCDAFLTKPLRLLELVKVVESLVTGGQPVRSPSGNANEKQQPPT
jgi:two-component system cell cycle response regulator DivK